MDSRWESTDEVRAGFVAHGRLVVWEGSTLVTARDGTGTDRSERGQQWRCPLGVGGVPATGVVADDLISVAGSCAVVAVQEGFRAVDFRPGSGVTRLCAGKPLAQVGLPGCWAGWIVDENGRAVLQVGRAQDSGEVGDLEMVDTSYDQELAPRGRMAARDGYVYWPGRDGALCRLDLAGLRVEPISDKLTGSMSVWVQADGPRVALETQSEVRVSRNALSGGRGSNTVPRGQPPLQAVFSLGSQLVVVGAKVKIVDEEQGGQQRDFTAPAGRLVSGFLVEAERGSSRFLTLSEEGGIATLTVMHTNSGSQQSLWREPRRQPLALIPAGDELHIIHTRGVVSLRK